MGKTNIQGLLPTTLIFLFFLPSMGFARCDTNVTVTGYTNGEWHAIKDDMSLRSGQQLRIALQTMSSCYMVFFWRDSQNQVFNLTPREINDQNDRKTVPSQIYVLPGNNGVYKLDYAPGNETLVSVTSDSPIIDLNSLGRLIAHRNFLKPFGSITLDQYNFKWRIILHRED